MHRQPPPRFTDRGRPVVVVAFDGWADAGSAATGAVDRLAEACLAETLGVLDTDDFYDYQVTRPHVGGQGAGRRLTWPGVTLRRGTIDGQEFLFLTGAEPSFRWRGFADAVLALLSPHQPQCLLVLGAVLGSAPHTRPVVVADGAGEPSYEGPVGIGTVIVEGAEDADIPTQERWATIPHYLSTEPNLSASLALVRSVAELTACDIPTAALDAAVATERERHDAEVAEDPDLAEYVAELEERHDDTADAATIGDAVEQFLRRQR